jgi:hypothetical protein
VKSRDYGELRLFSWASQGKLALSACASERRSSRPTYLLELWLRGVWVHGVRIKKGNRVLVSERQV